MLKFIMNAFKPVCNHKNPHGYSTYVQVQTIHGDLITALKGKRSLWKCKQCGEFSWYKSLTEIKK
jgi:hypothetical protein